MMIDPGFYCECSGGAHDVCKLWYFPPSSDRAVYWMSAGLRSSRLVYPPPRPVEEHSWIEDMPFVSYGDPPHKSRFEAVAPLQLPLGILSSAAKYPPPFLLRPSVLPK